jgi:hypothetical protein
MQCWDCGRTASLVHWEPFEPKVVNLQLQADTAEAQGPGFEDGHDWEGFNGGCSRLGCGPDCAAPPAAAGSALDVQVSGDHYKSLKIQPIEFIHANNIPFAEGSVIKYVTRWRNKNGLKDLEKAKHFIELLIELEQARLK